MRAIRLWRAVPRGQMINYSLQQMRNVMAIHSPVHGTPSARCNSGLAGNEACLEISYEMASSYRGGQEV